MSSWRLSSSILVPMIAALALVACGSGRKGGEKPAPSRAPEAAPGERAERASTAPEPGGIEVTLCDGKTTVVMERGTSGTALASALMAEWMRKNPNANWAGEELEKHALQPAADNSELVGQVQGQTYGQVTAQDVALWKSETERVALAGSQVFHDGDALGSTIGVSCDMCHPHAANTHPETYPKFQVQLGRVVLLRDMINWCIEHPVRGKPLAAEDPKMRALEAYILAQRSGAKLAYGKH